LRKRETDPDTRNQILDEGITDLKRLEHRINNLLTGSALLRGREMSGARTTFSNAAAVARACAAEIAPQARAGGVEVIVDAPDEFSVRMESPLLEKVIGNLILNAVQHSPSGGVVRVSLDFDSNSRKVGLLRIRDDGPGIPVAEREKVFQPLYRLELGTSRGTGMGLYIVREILTAANGSVRFVDMTGPGLLVEARIPVS
jgi:signal transduction histidine kinase